MKYCSKCGTSLPDDAKFCTACGEAVNEMENNGQGPQTESGSANAQGEEFNTQSEDPNTRGNTSGNGTESKFKEAFNKFNDTPDHSAELEKEDVEKNKGISVLSYFGLLLLIPLLVRPESKFAKYHANQGLVFFIASLIYSAVLAAVEAAIGGLNVLLIALIPAGVVAGLSIGFAVIGFVASLLGIVPLVFMIIGIVNVCNGKAKELPIIGKYRILK